MKNWILLLAVVLLFGACDDDFKVGADYKEVTIIYGLLDDGELSNQQFIKITKGFYSETEDNLLLAANKDSIYYQNLDVKVEEFNNGNLTNTFVCTKEDLNTIPNPYVKREGIFVDSPNYAYRFIADINPDRQYKLTVTNPASGSVITSETSVITTDPNTFTVIKPFTANDKLQFANSNLSYIFSWKAPVGSELFDIKLEFFYDDINLVNNDTTKKSVDLQLGSFIPRNSSSMSYEMQNVVFYSLLTANVGAAPANVVRRVDTSKLYFVAGDSVIQRYVDVNNAQGGLTSDQIKPFYTNLTRDGQLGKDVLGIFGTRATRFVGDIVFDDATYDSIINGSKTTNLNFVGRSLD
jgi:hypothetical protein